MALLTSVTGAAWPTSGTATTGTTGLNALGGTWTHATGDVPSGSSATGYIYTRNGGSFRLDGASTVQFSGAENWYWQEFYWKPVKLADFTDQAGGFCVIIGGTSLTVSMFARMPGSSGNINGGFTLYVNQFVTGVAGKYITNGLGGSPSEVVVPFDEWSKVTVYCYRNSTAGRWGLMINGTDIGGCQDFDTSSTGIADATLKSMFSWGFTRGSGNILDDKIEHRVSGTMRSYSSTDIVVRPDAMETNSFITKNMHHAPLNSALYTQGRHWTLSGTGTPTVDVYGNGGGVNPGCLLLTCGGSAGQTTIATSVDNLGTPDYNSIGWANIFFADIYVPDTGTADIQIRNSANSADLFNFSITSAKLFQTGTLASPGVALTTLSGSVRYSFTICISNNTTGDGYAEVTGAIWDNSDFRNTLVSFPLGKWTPAELGKVIVTITKQTTSPKFGSVQLCRTPVAAGVDSLSSADTNLETPVFQASNHLSAQWIHLQPVRLMAKADYPLKTYLAAKGMPRIHINAITGRSGKKRKEWTEDFVFRAAYLRGWMFMNLDGGSINDITNSMANQAAADAKLAEMENYFKMMFRALLPNNYIWLTTMIQRNLVGTGPTYNALANATILQLNNNIAGYARKYQYSRGGVKLVWFSDVAGLVDDDSMFAGGGGDNIHPNTAGSISMTQAQVNGKVEFPPYANSEAGMFLLL